MAPAQAAVPQAPAFAKVAVQLIVDNDYAAFLGDESKVTRLFYQNNVSWQTQITNSTTLDIDPQTDETYFYLAVMGGGSTEDFAGYLNDLDIVSIPGAQVASGRSPLGSASIDGSYLKLQNYISGYSLTAVAGGTQNVTLSQLQTALNGVTWSSAVATGFNSTGNVPTYKTTGVCCSNAVATDAGLSGKGWNFPTGSLVVFRYPISSLALPVSAGTGQVTVDWNEPASGDAPTGYILQYKKTSEADSAYTTFSTPPSSTTIETVTGLVSGFSYSFRVAGTNSSGTGIYSEVREAIPNGLAPPSSDTDAALVLNGTTQYGTASSDAGGFDITDAITIQAWIHPTGASCNSNIISKVLSYAIYCTSGILRYAMGGANTWAGVSTGITIPVNEWHHISLTRAAGTATAKIYIDGILQYSGTADGAGTSGLTNSSNLFTIGAQNGSATFFAGHIDEVKLWAAERSASEVVSDMKTYGGSLDSGLVAYYDFNDLYGEDVVNRSTNGSYSLNLNLVNSPSISSSAIFTTATNALDSIVTFTRTYLVANNGWKSPTTTDINYLIVGGGGGGGGGWNGGGGGGGGYLESTSSIDKNIYYPIVVGVGGRGGFTMYGPTTGNASTAFSVTALGGGGGGTEQHAMSGPNRSTVPDGSPGSGGSGGGGSHGATNTGVGGGSGTLGQGSNGGAGYSASSYYAGGGGGGSKAVGSTASTSAPGNGGAGKTSTITGSTLNFAGGGGGAGRYPSSQIKFGSGSFGGGSGGNTLGVSGTSNSGGGGGAGSTYNSGSATGGNGGSGIVIISYNPDTTAPAFTSLISFSVAENIATSVDAATITVNEDADLTISAGADLDRFNIIVSDSRTAVIRFKLSPDYEAPTDVGANNVYEITLSASDLMANLSTQAITITVTNVVDTSAFNGLNLAGGITSASYRTALLITADISVASKVTFRVNGKVIPGCKRRLATGAGSSFTVTCTWRPSMRGYVTLVATANPVAAAIPSATASPVKIFVSNRTGPRGG